MRLPPIRKISLMLVTALLLTGCAGLFNEIHRDTPPPTTPAAIIKATEKRLPDSSPTPSPPPTQQTPSPTNTILPSSTPTITHPYAVVGVEADDVLNIREGPGVENKVIGKIPPRGVNVSRIGEGKKVNDATWIPVRYQDIEGWVNDHFLAKQIGDPDPQLLAISNQVVLALGNKDFSALAGLVHPDKCVRFSPYPTVEREDQVFCPQEISQLLSDEDSYLWGQYDGTGKPIDMPFSEYYGEFVYDVNFAHAKMIGFNQGIGAGNAINNIHDYYPGSTFVEYHFPGFDPQYGGMDWRSLRLVFEKHNQEWFLVGIVHGEWTI